METALLLLGNSSKQSYRSFSISSRGERICQWQDVVERTE